MKFKLIETIDNNSEKEQVNNLLSQYNNGDIDLQELLRRLTMITRAQVKIPGEYRDILKNAGYKRKTREHSYKTYDNTNISVSIQEYPNTLKPEIRFFIYDLTQIDKYGNAKLIDTKIAKSLSEVKDIVDHLEANYN